MQTKKREWNMDYLRIFACFMVVFLHVSGSQWQETDVNSLEWKIFHYYDTAVRSCVPLFFMLSGKLFLAREQLPSISQLFKKNIFKFLIVYLAWALFYAIDTVGVTKILAGNALPLIWGSVLSAKYHLWYLPTLIGIYTLLPVLWCVAKYENGKYLKYVCGLFLLFVIVKNTGLAFVEDKKIHNFLGQFVWELSKYSGYFLLGYTLDKYKDKFAKVKWWMLLLGFVFVVGVTGIIGEGYAVSLGRPYGILYGYFLLPTYLEAVILFLLFMRIPQRNLSEKMQRVITKISKYTLVVYLLHVFVLEHLEINYNITTVLFHPLLSVPVFAIGIFVICLAVATIMDYIPIVRKWLM